MTAVTGLLAGRTGEVLTELFECPCGESFTARRRVVPDSRNGALNTCIDLDFTEARAFRLVHRTHT